MMKLYRVLLSISIISVISVIMISCQDHDKKNKTLENDLNDATNLSSNINPTEATTKNSTDHQSFYFRYVLNEGIEPCILNYELIEISGLSYDQKIGKLYGINDEMGMAFTINSDDCKIISRDKFAILGDYEGVEIVGSLLYIVRSNGDIYSRDMHSGQIFPKITSPLSYKNNVEGLAYNPNVNALILACKASPRITGKGNPNKDRAFYSFDLQSQELSTIPIFLISYPQLLDYCRSDFKVYQSKKDIRKKKHRLKRFAPSAIAFHPIEHNYYILSSVGKLMVICTEKGDILDIQFLDNTVYMQPEGICFAPDGTMYISNEGQSAKANIIKIGYQGIPMN